MCLSFVTSLNWESNCEGKKEYLAALFYKADFRKAIATVIIKAWAYFTPHALPAIPGIEAWVFHLNVVLYALTQEFDHNVLYFTFN